MVAAGESLFVSTGGPLAIIDKRNGSFRYAEVTGAGDWMSPPVADEDGYVYSFGKSGMYSFSLDGRVLWSAPFVDTTGAEFVETFAPALSPDRVLYGIGADSKVVAIDIVARTRLWAVPIDQSRGYGRVSGGAGDALFVHPYTAGTLVLSRLSGSEMGELRTSQGQRVVGYSGIWELGWDFGIGFGSLFCFDTCGRQKWSAWVDNSTWNEQSGIIAAGERLVAVKWQSDGGLVRVSGDQMSLYGPDGRVVGGPRAVAGKPYAAGRDGAIYTVDCEYSSPKANRIVAYSVDLQELWHFDIGEMDNCPVGNGVLEEDGVLYLAHALGTGAGIEVLAVQTQSPGLAESSWPSLRHDNRGTMWLSPLGPQ